jgi:hypothetical protein
VHEVGCGKIDDLLLQLREGNQAGKLWLVIMFDAKDKDAGGVGALRQIALKDEQMLV